MALSHALIKFFGRKKMKIKNYLLNLMIVPFALSVPPAQAVDFKYRSEVSLNVGQSVILKGVRNADCEDKAPDWGHINGRLPKSKLGQFADGGAGSVLSRSCGGKVGARGVKFIAGKPGTETLIIFKDQVSITVKTDG